MLHLVYDCDMPIGESFDGNSSISIERISFPGICDGYTELPPNLIDGRNETDETECDDYPCNNTYTRCDGIWNCLDGADEVNCEKPSVCPF
jgi:hypothetical protein